MMMASITAIFDWLLQWSDVIGSFGSILLSAVLVYFYKQMHDVQQAQAEIQEKQTELIESQTEISRANHEPELAFSNTSFGKRDTIKIEIENKGGGIATDLTLVCVLETDNDYYRIEPTQTTLTEFGDSISDQRRSLMAGEKGKFGAPVVVRLKSDYFSDTLSWFTTATAKLSYSGTQSATVRLMVQYKNILGDVKSKPLTTAPVWMSGMVSIEDAITQAMDTVAKEIPVKTGASMISSRNIGTQRSPGHIGEVSINFTASDLVLKYGMSLDIETGSEIECKIKRSQKVASPCENVASIGTNENQTIKFGQDENDWLELGELVHILGSTGEGDWQIDLLGAGDYPPNGPAHAAAMRRRQMVK